MATPLLDTLGNAGAQMGDILGAEMALSFGSPADELKTLTEGAGLLDLSAFPRYTLTGKDRARYLHGMTSADVKGLSTGEGAYATFMNGTGRTLGDTWYYALEDHILMILPPGVETVVMTHLDFYLIADRAEFAAISDSTALLSIQGPKAGDTLSQLGLTLPASNFGIALGEIAGAGVHIMTVDRGGAGGFDVMASAEDAPKVWAAIAGVGAKPAGMSALNVQRVSNGIPWPGHELTDKVIPMEAGLTDIAISFNKGCYLGQEVVAKIKYRGKINRIMTAFTLPGDHGAQEGDPLFFEGKKIGWLSSIVEPVDGPPKALGFLRRKAWEGAEAVAIGEGDAPVQAQVHQLDFPA